MKKSLFSIVIIVILGLIVSGCIAPLESVTPTSEKGNPKPELTSPIIQRGVFVDHGYSSRPWYPPSEETKSYRWAPRIYWVADDLPIDITVYTKNAPFGAFDAVLPAFDQWDENTLADLYDTTSENSENDPPGAVLWDGNTMSWMEIDNAGGIIGVCYYWYWTNTKEMIEFDIIFDKDENWLATDNPENMPTLTQFDVWNIAIHELGHALVLGDLRSPKDGALTMHAYTWKGDDFKRTLGSGDILGIQKIYGK
jgi:hypothetical protein